MKEASAAAPPGRDDLLDPEAVQRFILAWVIHERWYHEGRSNLEQYTWPVAGTREVASEGRAAYFAYRDWLAGVVLGFDGYGPLLDDVRALVFAIARTNPSEPRKLLLESAQQDATFRGQWENLFAVGAVWAGLTHDSLTAYVRKYEVEWPLRILVCLSEMESAGSYDPTLKRFRNKSGRVNKGALVNAVRTAFANYPALRKVIGESYVPALRNAVAHNEYALTGDGLRSLDGRYAANSSEIWKYMRNLSALQTALVRLESTATHHESALTPCGVLAIGWGRLDGRRVPEIVVLQLQAFRQYAPDAQWLTSCMIAVGQDEIETTLSGAVARRGALLVELQPVLAALRDGAPLACHVIGVVPCLHYDSHQHATYDLPEGRYCAFGAPVVRVINAVVRDGTDILPQNGPHEKTGGLAEACGKPSPRGPAHKTPGRLAPPDRAHSEGE